MAITASARSPQKTNEELIRIIRAAKIDERFRYDSEGLLDEKIRFLAQHCPKILDVGKSSRQRYAWFRPGQAITMDINRYEDYPDVIDDLCDVQNLSWESFDGIVCMAVLEHVYAPHLAVENLRRLLRPGGYCLVYAPYVFRYHAPADLQYQDYFRFSRDALAYLFREFSEVTLFPVRGQYSSLFNMLGFWKTRIEGHLGQALNRVLDRALGAALGHEHTLHASGYTVWARR